MEIRVLRYFLAVAREGTIVRAANFLQVTQPTLSRQLQDLEDELGQKLFIRSNRNITLTPEGMFLRRRAEEIMEMVNKTETDFSVMGESVRGKVYIGGGESDAMRLIADVIHSMRQEYPEVRCHIFSGNAADVMERLDKGILDFGVLIHPVDISKYDSITLPVKNLWGVIMRKDSPLAAKKHVEPGDLVNLPLICSRMDDSGPSRNPFAAWFGAGFEKLNVVATYNLIYNAALMVDAGIGYALSLNHLSNIDSRSSLCFRPLQPRLESGLSIVWKKYQVFNKAAEVFKNRIEENFAADQCGLRTP